MPAHQPIIFILPVVLFCTLVLFLLEVYKTIPRPHTTLLNCNICRRLCFSFGREINNALNSVDIVIPTLRIFREGYIHGLVLITPIQYQSRALMQALLFK